MTFVRQPTSGCSRIDDDSTDSGIGCHSDRTAFNSSLGHHTKASTITNTTTSASPTPTKSHRRCQRDSFRIGV